METAAKKKKDAANQAQQETDLLTQQLAQQNQKNAADYQQRVKQEDKDTKLKLYMGGAAAFLAIAVVFGMAYKKFVIDKQVT